MKELDIPEPFSEWLLNSLSFGIFLSPWRLMIYFYPIDIRPGTDVRPAARAKNK